MIIFRGKLNEECLKYIKKKKLLGAFIHCIVCFLLTAIPVMCFAFAVSYWCLLSLIFMCALCMGITSADRSFRDIPTETHIDDDYITSIGSQCKNTVPLNEILEITDMGTWYKLKFNLKFNMYFVCQKDLLVEGTLEEFEEIFKDKLVVYEPKKKQK